MATETQEDKLVEITCKLPPDEHARLKSYCALKRLTIAEGLKKAVLDILDREDKANARRNR